MKNWILSSMLITASLFAAESELDIMGVGFTQFQGGLTPMFKGSQNFDYNPIFLGVGLLFLNGKVGENWSTTFSMGVGYGNTAIRKSMRDSTNSFFIGKTNPHSIGFGAGPFLHEAAAEYKAEKYQLKIGKFHYLYSKYNTNMGLYLLRGPVYPGFLYSGFEDIGALSKTGFLNTFTPNELIKLDLLVTFESEYKPYFDVNLSSFLTLNFGALEIGAGFESQRLIELNSCVTSPKNGDDLDGCLGGDPGSGYVGLNNNDPANPGVPNDPYKGAFFIIDTTGEGAGATPDTTTYTLAGTKVMMRGALDIKKLTMPDYSGSVNDFVLYTEAALIGVKDYPHIYDNRAERIPVLFGFNIPTFGLLDLLSLEIEYYNSPYQNDPYKLIGAYDVFSFSDGNSINYAFSPIPPSPAAGSPNLNKAYEDYDVDADNLKWSLYFKKSILDKIIVSAQLASDHWRTPNSNLVHSESLVNPGQFYGSIRLMYLMN